uniref:Putative secreted protein n=1 Tax=Anopheles triannulatus TaxID=58253 RepID=A0A2M4B0W0_9DIPT
MLPRVSVYPLPFPWAPLLLHRLLLALPLRCTLPILLRLHHHHHHHPRCLHHPHHLPSRRFLPAACSSMI